MVHAVQIVAAYNVLKCVDMPAHNMAHASARVKLLDDKCPYTHNCKQSEFADACSTGLYLVFSVRNNGLKLPKPNMAHVCARVK